MRTISKKGRAEEARISLHIKSAKAVACFKKYQETGEVFWFDQGFGQMLSANKYLQVLSSNNPDWIEELTREYDKPNPDSGSPHRIDSHEFSGVPSMACC